MPTVRGRGEGSLFRRARDKRWVASVTMPDGRRRSASAERKTDAVHLLRDLIDQRDRSVAEDPRRVRVGPFLRAWVNRLSGLAPATIRQHEMIVRRHLEPAFRHRLLTALTPGDVEAYLASKRLDAQTLRHHRATFRLALNDAIRNGLVSRNAAALAKAPRLAKPERKVLSPADVDRLLTEGQDDRLWPLYALVVSTGLRISEALGLAWSDIDWETRELHVRRTLHRIPLKDPRPKRPRYDWTMDVPKTPRSRRTIPLVPDALAALRVQLQRQDAERGEEPQPIKGLVFATASGLPIHSSNILPEWRELAKRLGLPRVTVHDLRHSAASRMLAYGVPLPVIADMLGHSSIRVTADLYAHRSADLRQAEMAKLPKVLG